MIGIGVICNGQLPVVSRRPVGGMLAFVNATVVGRSLARNNALHQLQGCEHIFLLEDDCQPLRDGWSHYLINQFVEHNVHYAILPDVMRSLLREVRGETGVWTGSGNDSMIYQSAHALDVIGGFDEGFFDDVSRTDRAIKAGLTGQQHAFQCPVRAMGLFSYNDDRLIIPTGRDGHTYFPI